MLRIKNAASEFECQGLELDFPLVCWGNDLTWRNGWVSSSRQKARNPHQLRINVYRVLLTRGRDGMVIYVGPDKGMDMTYQALVSAGLQVLPN